MSHRIRRSLGGLVALVTALALSGCYYVDALFDVNLEEELDVRIDSAVHEDFADADTARSALQDQFSGEGMSRSEYSQGPWNGYRWTENNGDPYNWEITRDNGDFIRFARDGDYVKYTAKFTIGGEVGDREDEAREVLDVRFTLDHAGDVISTNGNQSSDTRIRWTGQWDSTMNMEAVIDLTPEPEPAPAQPAPEPQAQQESTEAPVDDNVVVAEEPVADEEVVQEQTEPEETLAIGDDAIGQTALATAEITVEGGEIAFDGSVFSARTVAGIIPAGADAVVVAIDGDTVVVEAVDEPTSLVWLWWTLAALVLVAAGVTMWLMSRKRPGASDGEDQVAETSESTA